MASCIAEQSKGSAAAYSLSVTAVALFSIVLSTPANAETSQTALNLSIAPVLSLSLSNCDGSNAASVVLNVDPSPSGTFKSACQNVNVDTNAPGYTLTVKSSSTDLLYQNPTTISPLPTVPSTDTGTIATPQVLPNDKWGFAVENQLDFDNSYTINNQNNKFALLPTTDAQIYTTDAWPLPLNQFRFYYGAKLTPETVAGTYSTTITYTAIGAEVPEPPQPPTTMQSMTAEYCANSMEIYWNNGDGNKLLTLTDTRNNQQYLVGKLADGNCWMLNNLKLGSTAATTTLTPADSNVATARTLPVVGTSMNGNTATPAVADYAIDHPNPGGDNIFSDTFYGYYYNWCAAKANTPESCFSILPSLSTEDICPVGWRLPTNGAFNFDDYTATSPNEFVALNAAMYSGVTNGSNYYDEDHAENWLFGGPFRGVFAGYAASTVWENQGNSSGIWSGSYYTYQVWGVGFSSYLWGSSVAPDGIFYTADGSAARCLLGS